MVQLVYLHPQLHLPFNFIPPTKSTPLISTLRFQNTTHYLKSQNSSPYDQFSLIHGTIYYHSYQEQSWLPFSQGAGFGFDRLGNVCLTVASGGDPMPPNFYRQGPILTVLNKLLS